MTFLQMEYFVEAARSGSFSRAAEKLYISHQALSLQIKALEKELGIELFDRSNKRSLSLNESGEILFKEWESILSHHRNAVQRAKDTYLRKPNTIRVGVHNVSVIRDITLQYLNEKLLNENENIEFQVATPGVLLRKLEADELDICSVISYSLLNHDHLQSVEIGNKRAKPVIAVSKSNPLSQREALTLTDIRDEQIIIFDEDYSDDAEARIFEDFKNAGIRIKPLKKLKNIQEVKIAVCMNQGVALILDLVMADLLDKVRLFEFRETAVEEMAKISLVWKNEKWDRVFLQN